MTALAMLAQITPIQAQAGNDFITIISARIVVPLGLGDQNPSADATNAEASRCNFQTVCIFQHSFAELHTVYGVPDPHAGGNHMLRIRWSCGQNKPERTLPDIGDNGQVHLVC